MSMNHEAITTGLPFKLRHSSPPFEFTGIQMLLSSFIGYLNLANVFVIFHIIIPIKFTLGRFTIIL